MSKTAYHEQRHGPKYTPLSKADQLELDKIIKQKVAKYPEEEKLEYLTISIKLRMQHYLENPQNKIIETGSFLNEFLLINKINKRVFADFIDSKNSNLHALLSGRRKFNKILATKIGAIFNVPAELWLFIEAKNELLEFNQNNSMDLSKYKIEELID